MSIGDFGVFIVVGTFALIGLLLVRHIVLWYTGITLVVNRLDSVIAELKRLNPPG